MSLLGVVGRLHLQERVEALGRARQVALLDLDRRQEVPRLEEVRVGLRDRREHGRARRRAGRGRSSTCRARRASPAPSLRAGRFCRRARYASTLLVVAGAQRDLDQPLQRLLLRLRPGVLGDRLLEVVRAPSSSRAPGTATRPAGSARRRRRASSGTSRRRRAGWSPPPRSSSGCRAPARRARGDRRRRAAAAARPGTPAS